jgi:sigma-B regulation protein RsbU (phosphoserine phosphatase)
MMFKINSLALKLALPVVLVCGGVFALAIGRYHDVASRLLQRNVEVQAQQLLGQNSAELDSFFMPAKTAPQELARMLDHGRMDKDDLISALKGIVASNPDIFGAAVAYEPGGYVSGQRFFCPYVCRAKTGLKVVWLGSDERDYNLSDWYQIPRETGQPQWSEPYYGSPGEGADQSSRVMMVTYSAPFFRSGPKGREVAGVVTADVDIDAIAKKISAIKVLQSGYAFLLSRDGTYIAHPQRDRLMNETIFSIAEQSGSDALREAGRAMISGRSGSMRRESTLNGKMSLMYYTPVKTTGWSLAVMFPEDEYLADINHLNKLVLVLCLAGLLVLIGSVWMITRSMMMPLSAMSAAAEHISKGWLNEQLPEIKTSDEVGKLYSAFAHMQASLRDYIARLTSETAARQKMESELAIAREIQFNFLPKRLPVNPAFEAAAALEPAKEVGGDFYDCFMLDANRLCMVIGDVSGKGVPAALFMGMAKALIKNAALRDAPGAALARVNDQLCDGNDSGMFVTVFIAVLDTATGEVTYASAGHNPPAVIRGTLAESLKKLPGPVAGIMPNAVFSQAKLVLSPGDMLVIYTDGVTESSDPSGKLYSEERLLEFCALRYAATAGDFVRALMRELDEYSRGIRSDDTTLLVLRYNGIPKS